MKDNGLFIVFEGVDGSGKSTQIEMLSELLVSEGYEVELHREPTLGFVGSLILEYADSKSRSLKPETEALLFAADRVEHGKSIQQALEKGCIVICDRYVHSSLAYQGGAGVDVEWIKVLNRHALKPDLVVLLDIDPNRSLDRVNSRDRTVFEENSYLRKVRDVYHRFAEIGELTVIDASQGIDAVHTEIIKLVTMFLG